MSATSGTTGPRWSVLRSSLARASVLAAVLLTVLLLAAAHAEERPAGPEPRAGNAPGDAPLVERSRDMGSVEPSAPSPDFVDQFVHVDRSAYVYPSDDAGLAARVRERALQSNTRDHEPLLFP